MGHLLPKDWKLRKEVKQYKLGWSHDTRSILKIGSYTLVTHWDHKGNYEGHQAKWEHHYRGTHFHIESDNHTQEEIMFYLYFDLLRIGAKTTHCAKLAIGNIEDFPLGLLMFEMDTRTQALWIGQNLHLHVEANKPRIFAQGILTKEILVRMIKNWLNQDWGIDPKVKYLIDHPKRKIIKKTIVAS